MASISLRKIVERTLDGEIRIPAFQRGFVWTPDGVAFLMDSIYRGYPIGSLLVWRTKEPLAKEKNLGPFELPEPKADWPIDYVLDGQQRITSIFGVFQTELSPVDRGEWFNVYFDLRAPEGALEGQFVAIPDEEVDPSRHFPLDTLFDTVAYRKATEALSEQDIKRVDSLQARFKEALIPVTMIDTPERHEVAIIFERINRTGVPLDAFQLLSAWTWSTEFDLAEAFQELAAEVEPFGFGKIEGDPNLLMKCCAAVIAGDASPKTIVDLHGPTVRERFDEVRSGIHGAIDFLRKQLKVHSLTVMPFPAMIVPLARFFATTKAAGLSPTSRQREEISRWFWRGCFSRRYSSGVGRAHATDIRGMTKLKDDETATISNFAVNVDERFFLDNQFNLASVNTRTFILLLAQYRPRTFISGQSVGLAKVLKICNRAEFHHIFPKKCLDTLGFDVRQQNVLANVCFLSNADNQKIKAKSPSEYKALLPETLYAKIFASNLIPDNGLDIGYEDFLQARAPLLAAKAQDLIA